MVERGRARRFALDIANTEESEVEKGTLVSDSHFTCTVPETDMS